MLSRTSEQELKDNLIIAIDDYEVNKLFSELAKALQHKIKISKLSDLYRKEIQLNMFSLYELYHLSKGLKNIVSKIDLKNTNLSEKDFEVEKYFTKIEIEKFENYVEEIEETQDSNVIVLHDVIEVVPDKQWIYGKSSVKEIANIVYKGLVKYDFRMQRQTEKVKLRGKYYERAMVYKKSIREISNAMLNGEYDPTAITFNILKNGFEKYEYDKETLTLTIIKDDDSQISIVDGWNRTVSGLEALNVNPDLNQPMMINIIHRDINGARAFIRQEAHHNAINPALLKFYDTANVYNEITRAIGEDGNKKTNLMFGNVGTEMLDVQNLNKYTTFEILQIAIEDNFKVKEDDIRERRMIKQYLNSYFNELVSILKDEFAKVRMGIREDYSVHHNTFYGYIALASVLYNKEQWEDKLFNIIQNIDFSKENKMWKEFNIEKDKMTAKPKKAIYDYFKSLANDIESESV